MEEIALLNTTLVRSDGRRVWYPNAKLVLDPLVNISRSGALSTSVSALVWRSLLVGAAVLKTIEIHDQLG